MTNRGHSGNGVAFFGPIGLLLISEKYCLTRILGYTTQIQNSTMALVTLEQIGVDPNSGENDQEDFDDQLDNDDEGGEVPSLSKDLSALDVPQDRTPSTDPAKTGDTPPTDPGTDDEPKFEEVAPIADWEEQAKKYNYDVSSEQDFRRELEVGTYVRNIFFADPVLTQAQALVSQENVPARALIEFDIRSNKEEWENEADIKEKIEAFIDEDGELTEKGERRAGHVKSKLQKMISSRVSELEKEARQTVSDNNLFDTTLKDSIKQLPKDIYSAADKSALYKYIQSGQYQRDALGVDGNGKAVDKGDVAAKKILEYAQKINPVFSEKQMRAFHADAKALGVDEYLKKYNFNK